MNLLRLFARPASAPAAFPEGRVGYAVGDIHGRSDLLAEMLAELEKRAGQDRREGGPPVVVFLGDYVDRGPDSAGVLDMLLTGQPSGCERRYLKGNHEQSMLAFLGDPLSNRAWILQGGAETLMSYGVQPPQPLGAQDADWTRAAQELAAKLPAAHRAFLEGLERYVALGGYAFVHAGVDDARSLETQTDEALYWSRKAFLASKRRFSHCVVHGHTPVDAPYADRRRVAVDTGAYASGRLSAARFESERIEFITVAKTGGARRAQPANAATETPSERHLHRLFHGASRFTPRHTSEEK
jgi:serine/threonine protein phosphatase 1